MRPLRLKIEDAVQQLLESFNPAPLKVGADMAPHNMWGRPQNSGFLVARWQQRKEAWKEQYQAPLVSALGSNETRALASRVLASGLAQGCIGFSLTMAASLFNRLTEARGYYISRIPRPLHPPRNPLLRPALEQGMRATILGIQTTLIDELLVKLRGEDKATSNAFWSGFLVSAIENRKGGAGLIVEEGLKGGTTSLLFHTILGGTEETATASVGIVSSSDEEEQSF